MNTKENNLMQYVEYTKKKELSKSTREIYIREAERFQAYVGEKAINKQVVEKYLMDMKSKYKEGTVNLYTVAINRYLNYIGKGSCTAKVKRLKRKRNLNNILSMEEYKRLLLYTNQSGREKYYYIMKTLAATGIRISELKYITYESLIYGHTEVYNKGRTREVYLSDSIIMCLTQYCKKKNHLRLYFYRE